MPCPPLSPSKDMAGGRRGGVSLAGCAAAAGWAAQAVCGCDHSAGPSDGTQSAAPPPQPAASIREAGSDSGSGSSSGSGSQHVEPGEDHADAGGAAAPDVSLGDAAVATSSAAEASAGASVLPEVAEDEPPAAYGTKTPEEAADGDAQLAMCEALLERRLAAYEASTPSRCSRLSPPPHLLADSPPEAEESCSASGLPVWRLPPEDSPVHSTHAGFTPVEASPSLKSVGVDSQSAAGVSPEDMSLATRGRVSSEEADAQAFTATPPRAATSLGWTPGTQASLASWQPSAGPRLSPGELALLREQALGEACPSGPFWSAVPNDPSPALPESRTLGSMSSPTPTWQSSPLTGSALQDTPMQPMTGPLWSLSVPPDAGSTGDLMPVHSSALDCARPEGGFPRSGVDIRLFPEAFAQASLQGAAAVGPGAALGLGGTPDPPGGRIISAASASSGQAPGSTGFIGRSPFWTCGSTPHARGHRARRGSAAASANTSAAQSTATDTLQSLVGGAMGGGSTVAGPVVAAAAAAGGASSGELASRISSVIENCIELLAQAVDAPTDSPPPEEELTTVLLETKEQKLQWREFLSEAVSKFSASSLFRSYDVEASPPRYAKPPLSMPKSSPGASSSGRCRAPLNSRGPHPPSVGHLPPRQADPTPPHIVAPRGAGWSPLLAGIRRHSPAPSLVSSIASVGGNTRSWLFKSWEGCGPQLPNGRPTCPAMASCRAAESSPGPIAPSKSEMHEPVPRRRIEASAEEQQGAAGAKAAAVWCPETDEAPGGCTAPRGPPPAG
uniref:Uncharacterized protein n=1 Tax=Alexandrium monilatum TaxID=311494 RepID=A0A7S4QGG0_9DINO